MGREESLTKQWNWILKFPSCAKCFSSCSSSWMLKLHWCMFSLTLWGSFRINLQKKHQFFFLCSLKIRFQEAGPMSRVCDITNCMNENWSLMSWGKLTSPIKMEFTMKEETLCVQQLNWNHLEAERVGCVCVHYITCGTLHCRHITVD